MNQGHELSRRGLLGAGLGRLLDGGLARGDATVAPPERQAQPAPSFAGWGEGDADGLGARLEPVAGALLQACDVRPGVRVLVAAAGDGVLARAAARLGAHVTAVEASAERVERGRALCAQEGLEVAWAVGPPSQMPVDEGAHDAVISLFGASHADDPRAVAAQLTRAARPGVPIALTAWSGFMAELLRVVGRRATHSQRWGRFETAYLHFFEYPELDVREAAVQWRFGRLDEATDELAGPVAGTDAETRVRDALPALLDRHGEAAGPGGVMVRASYATVFARRP